MAPVGSFAAGAISNNGGDWRTTMADARTYQDETELPHATGEAKEGLSHERAEDKGSEPTTEHAPFAAHDGSSVGSFLITHYTFALESDPKHHDSPKVSAPGLPP